MAKMWFYEIARVHIASAAHGLPGTPKISTNHGKNQMQKNIKKVGPRRPKKLSGAQTWAPQLENTSKIDPVRGQKKVPKPLSCQNGEMSLDVLDYYIPTHPGSSENHYFPFFENQNDDQTGDALNLEENFENNCNLNEKLVSKFVTDFSAKETKDDVNSIEGRDSGVRLYNRWVN